MSSSPSNEMSGTTTPTTEPPSPPAVEEINISSSLAGLQTEEQRRFLDIIGQVRTSGLEGVLSIPQLVVCGDQSAGKSSVLEALTEIPFPRNDNLCTRYATEFVLLRAKADSLTIKVIPDENRPVSEQVSIKAFTKSITDFDELPSVFNAAMDVMGISTTPNSTDSHSFSKDVLSITIEGPNRPQLTLVDIPGLIGTATKGTTDDDVALVAEITERYISQPRTICLAVVSAAADHATQSILKKVRAHDKDGSRTLGIITKPDRIEGNGSKEAYIDLAQNEDIIFKLGWHVVKNRPYDKKDCSLQERKDLETEWFRKDPHFKALPKHTVGIDSLRKRLGVLLFEHVKRELPKLRQELEDLLEETQYELKLMGTRRSSAAECKEYLSNFSSEFQDICRSAMKGDYEGPYFRKYSHHTFDISSPSSYCRARAVVQSLNTKFSNTLRTTGEKYRINMSNLAVMDPNEEHPWLLKKRAHDDQPINLNRAQALAWVHEFYERTRGRELPGNFNPLLIGELFWDQSSKWGRIADAHLNSVAELCTEFLRTLLTDKCPADVQPRIWEYIKEEIRERKHQADRELEFLLEDLQGYPINYNHYYTDTINKRRFDRQKALLTQCCEDASTQQRVYGDQVYDDPVYGAAPTTNVDLEKLVASYSKTSEEDMEKVACEEALDSLFAIYKVIQKTFIANVTTQVIERHIIKKLEEIFSPQVVIRLSDEDAKTIAAEPEDSQLERQRLEKKLKKLKDGQEAFRSIMGVSARS